MERLLTNLTCSRNRISFRLSRCWLLASVLTSLSGCRWETERADTSKVAKVQKLPQDDIDTVPGDTVELGLQMLDAENKGVNGLRVFFASSSSKLTASGDGDSEIVATSATSSFLDTSGDGIALTKWDVPADAAPGEVFVYGHLVADASGDDTTTNSVLGVKAFTIAIK